MKKEKILQKLKIDEDYYGEFGNQFLSNSHVGRLLKDPLNVFKSMKPSPAFLVGGYFHTELPRSATTCFAICLNAESNCPAIILSPL